MALVPVASPAMAMPVALSFLNNKAAADNVIASIGDGISSAHPLDVFKRCAM